MHFTERYQYNAKTDLIGKGGFARVFKAYDKRLSRYVALKVYKSSDASEKYGLDAEIKRIIQLDHPNICRYYDIEELHSTNGLGEEEVSQICILELLDGGDLDSAFRNAFSKEAKLKLLRDVLRGLAYLHQNNIIHRDLKPQNVLIKKTPEGSVAKITDFGISKKANTENSNSSALMGSIEYMAPEQFNPGKYGIGGKISFNLDLWCFGIMVYELLTKTRIFGSRDTGDSSEQVMSNILTVDVSDFETLEEPFRTITQKCLVKNANERVRTADGLLKIIDEYLKPEETLQTGKGAPTSIIRNYEAVEAAASPAEKTVAKRSSLGLALLMIGGIALGSISMFFIAPYINMPVQAETTMVVPIDTLMNNFADSIRVIHDTVIVPGPVTPAAINLGAAVSAAKMNVLYIGVDNPITIAVPGVEWKNVKATLEGQGSLTKAGDGTYVANVSGVGSCNIRVSVLVDGQSKNVGSYKFRIKRIPDPQPSLGGKLFGGNTLPGAIKAQSGIAPLLKDFDFDVRFNVVSFQMVFSSKGELFKAETQGPLFSEKMKAFLDRADPKDIIFIDEIKVIGPDNQPRRLGQIAFTII